MLGKFGAMHIFVYVVLFIAKFGVTCSILMAMYEMYFKVLYCT